MPRFPSLPPAVLVGSGAHAGALLTFAGIGLASSPDVAPSAKKYVVSIDEVRQNFVFAAPVSGAYTHAVTLSDGSTREVILRPVRRDGMEVVELTDKGPSGAVRSYMGPNGGTTTHGKLMVSVMSEDDMRAFLDAARKAEHH